MTTNDASTAREDDWGEGLPRPWEQPGCVPRDCPPHRGELLRVFSTISLVCGILSFFLVVPAVAGFALGGLTGKLAIGDLDRMAKGLMDPTGRAETARALKRADAGVSLSLVGPAVFFALPIVLPIVLTGLKWLAN